MLGLDVGAHAIVVQQKTAITRPSDANSTCTLRWDTWDACGKLMLARKNDFGYPKSYLLNLHLKAPFNAPFQVPLRSHSGSIGTEILNFHCFATKIFKIVL